MLNTNKDHGQDSHQGGRIDHRTGQENCKLFLPFLENMIIFMILDIWICGGLDMIFNQKMKHNRPLIHNFVPVFSYNGKIGPVLV